jgi:negative regulator of sigma E activity
MNDASRLLEGELTAAELTALLERLKQDASLRDDVTSQQLVRDGVAGLRALDDGYTLRIVARLRRAQAQANHPNPKPQTL